MTTNAAHHNQTELTGPHHNGPVDVCDSCLLLAYDAGIEGIEAQSYAMREAGEVLHDHLCDAKEEPEYFPQGCACGCFRM